MIRVVIENLLLFLLPTAIFIAWRLVMRGGETTKRPLDDAPLIWLFAAGVVLVIATLTVFETSSGGKPGQAYEPPVFKDGKIEPGHIR